MSIFSQYTPYKLNGERWTEEQKEEYGQHGRGENLGEGGEKNKKTTTVASQIKVVIQLVVEKSSGKPNFSLPCIGKKAQWLGSNGNFR